MRTETVTVEYYEFNELSNEAKENAINAVKDSTQYRDYMSFGFENITERWTECLEKFGFIDSKISWSGFCCQGDGASFTCRYIDPDKIINSLLMEGENYQYAMLDRWIYHEIVTVSMSVHRYSSHYCHEKTCNVTSEYNFDYDGKFPKKAYEFFSTLLDEFIVSVEDFRLALCKKIYEELEKEDDYLLSDDAITGYIEEERMEFNKYGTAFFSK